MHFLCGADLGLNASYDEQPLSVALCVNNSDNPI